MTLEHMHKKFEINRTKVKGGCQSGSKVVSHNSKSDLPLEQQQYLEQQRNPHMNQYEA